MGDYHERLEGLLNEPTDHEKWRLLMTALDDLTAAVQAAQDEQTAEHAAITSAITDLQAEVANLQASGVSSAGVEAAVAKLQAVTTAATADASTATAADPGAPAPAPAPAPADTTTPAPSVTDTVPPADNPPPPSA